MSFHVPASVASTVWLAAILALVLASNGSFAVWLDRILKVREKPHVRATIAAALFRALLLTLACHIAFRLLNIREDKGDLGVLLLVIFSADVLLFRLISRCVDD